MAKTKRESDRKRKVANLLVLSRSAKSLQASAEKLEHTGPAERKRVASVPQREREVDKNARAAFAKRERNRAVYLEHQILRRAYSVREVKRAAAEERERDEYSSAEGQCEPSEKQSHSNELSKN